MAYNLGFIADESLFSLVKNTIERYRFNIDLKTFNKNIIDPIKLTFDSKVYVKSLEDVIEAEVLRQLDKSNNNHIGYFHQNIFAYIGHGWTVPKQGFDVVNLEKEIYVELKNKHNTMNAASSQKTYIGMQSKLLESSQATCYLVEVIAAKSQNITWSISLDKKPFKNDRIRRISIDQFYALVTGNDLAFFNLCNILPQVIDDVLSSINQNDIMSNTVLAELQQYTQQQSISILSAIYRVSFKSYLGFNHG